MMNDNLTITTPAMLFPAISLLLLAYTNRYLTISNRVRSLFDSYLHRPDKVVLQQIQSLRYRLSLIRWTQVFGVSSLLLCVIVIFCMYVHWVSAAHWFVGLSLVLMIVSLILSVMELNASNAALNILLSDIESVSRRRKDKSKSL